MTTKLGQPVGPPRPVPLKVVNGPGGAVWPGWHVIRVAAMTLAKLSEIKQWQLGNVELLARKVIAVDLGGRMLRPGWRG